MELGPARAKLWLPARKVASPKAAERLIGKLGFVLAFPVDGVMLPSLYEAVAGPDAIAWQHGMGEAESLVWQYKDSLPAAGVAWSGKLLHRRASLLAPDLVTALYEGDGDADDHRSFDLSEEAHRIADALAGGPLPTSALRELVGKRSRYDRAMLELHRHLLVTSAGVREQASGWPVVVVELTCRAFDVGGRADRAVATQRFLGTVLAAGPAELAKAFGWSAAGARAALDSLVDSGRARRDAGRYLAA
ncbi:MAG TPA: hypothetical protein VF062_03945 [Candidatus Limnocylindrales bacterium]